MEVRPAVLYLVLTSEDLIAEWSDKTPPAPGDWVNTISGYQPVKQVLTGPVSVGLSIHPAAV